MTNLGFRLAHGGDGHRGGRDRRSATATCSRRSTPAGSSLGGEQSGHVIFRDLATTGDGLLTGVQLLDVVARTGRPLGRARRRVDDPTAAGAAQRAGRRADDRRSPTTLAAEIAAAEAELGDHGRVLVRAERHRAARAGDGRGARPHEQADAVADRLGRCRGAGSATRPP